MKVLLFISMLILSESPALAKGPACSAYPVQAPAGRLDLTPPIGFVEICSQDAKLCDRLTRGYPPSVQTVGYFVSPQEWAQFKKGTLLGFSHYLIAQVSRSTPPDRFPGVKDFIRSRQGAVPDHTDLPGTLKSQGRVSLGVIEETTDSISFGAIMKNQAVSSPETEIALVSINAALVTGPHVLSLYLFRAFHTMKDVEMSKELTKTWLQCIRISNRKVGPTGR
jgi:hypothetical protein